jgi:hypothetical protein
LIVHTDKRIYAMKRRGNWAAAWEVATMEEPMMTEAQRDELKTLCQKADVPDKSGELLTQEGAQHFIDTLKKQMAERQ